MHLRFKLGLHGRKGQRWVVLTPVIDKDDCQSNHIDDWDNRDSGKEKNPLLQPYCLCHLKKKKSWLEMSKFASPSPCDAVNFNLNHFLAFSLHSFPSFSLVHLVFISLSVSTPVSTLIISLRTSANKIKE